MTTKEAKDANKNVEPTDGKEKAEKVEPTKMPTNAQRRKSIKSESS